MSARLSLRDRVLAGFAVIAAIAVAIAVVVTVTSHNYQVQLVDERLESFAGPDRLEQPVQPLPGGPREVLPRRSDALRGFLESDGSLHVFFAPNTEGADDSEPVIDPDDLSTSKSTYLTAASSSGGADFRVLARPIGGGWDITALSLADVDASTQQLVVIETVGIVLMLGGLAVVAWWVIRLGIAPMRRMVDASTQVASGDLDVRIDGDGASTEAEELADALNQMIATLTGSLQERERSEARLREFVADASHELRTPLTTVLGYSELHRRGALTKKADQNDAWARTEAEAERMRRLVDDMLELAKYDAEPVLAQETVDLATLSADVAAGASAAYPSTSFGAEGAHVAVTGDPDKLRQALLNVVANAAIHGGAQVTVAVAAGDDSAIVTVTDDGPGMPPEVAARATERFVRGDSSRQRATGGTGLGLAITAAIVDAHGGELTVDSTEGDGTVVTITLPVPRRIQD